MGEERILSQKEKKENNKKYVCWINEEDKILSFTYIEGYELKAFDTETEFKDYYYNKSYWGYKVT